MERGQNTLSLPLCTDALALSLPLHSVLGGPAGVIAALKDAPSPLFLTPPATPFPIEPGSFSPHGYQVLPLLQSMMARNDLDGEHYGEKRGRETRGDGKAGARARAPWWPFSLTHALLFLTQPRRPSPSSKTRPVTCSLSPPPCWRSTRQGPSTRTSPSRPTARTRSLKSPL